MIRTKYELYYSALTLSDIQGIKDHFTKEELIELDKKTFDITGNISGFESLESRIVAERWFMYGYLAAHANYPEENNN